MDTKINTEELVQAILDEHNNAKNNYNELVLRTWRACGAKIPDHLINYVKWHCPSPETISRVHRTLKNKPKIVKGKNGSKLTYPYKPDPEVLASRKAKQMRMTKMFSKKQEHGLNKSVGTSRS